MNGHDDLIALTPYDKLNMEYDEEGNEIEVEEEPRNLVPGNPIIDYDKEGLLHNQERLAHEDLMDRLSFNQDDR